MVHYLYIIPGGDDGMISLLSLMKSLSSRDFIQIIIVHYVHLMIPTGDENHICPIDKGGPCPACGKPRGNRNPHCGSNSHASVAA